MGGTFTSTTPVTHHHPDHEKHQCCCEAIASLAEAAAVVIQQRACCLATSDTAGCDCCEQSLVLILDAIDLHLGCLRACCSGPSGPVGLQPKGA